MKKSPCVTSTSFRVSHMQAFVQILKGTPICWHCQVEVTTLYILNIYLKVLGWMFVFGQELTAPSAWLCNCNHPYLWMLWIRVDTKAQMYWCLSSSEIYDPSLSLSDSVLVRAHFLSAHGSTHGRCSPLHSVFQINCQDSNPSGIWTTLNNQVTCLTPQ